MHRQQHEGRSTPSTASQKETTHAFVSARSPRLKSRRIYVLSAPSGTGKTTVAHGLLQQIPTLTRSISHTTRPRRPAEHHGIDYYFISLDQFAQMAEEDQFIEHATIYGYRYGTAKSTIQSIFANDHDALLVIDFQGARSVRHAFPEAITIFLLPPSKATLLDRLYGRSQDQVAEIKKRLATVKQEVACANEFHHVVINDDLHQTVATIQQIIQAPTQRIAPSPEQLNALLNDLMQ